MKFNIWTFLLQIINFAVLLFILKRLLYKPVREIMEKRRNLISKNLEEIESAKREAEELKEKNQKELDRFKEMHLEMSEKMKEEVAEERKRLLSETDKEAAMIIEKENALFDSKKIRFEETLKDMSVETVGVFAANLLTDITDEQLHRAIYRKSFNETGRIVSDINRMAKGSEPVKIDIISAYPMNENEIAELQRTLESQYPGKLTLGTSIDKNLIAGIKVRVYDMVYDFSLAGQIASLKIKIKENM